MVDAGTGVDWNLLLRGAIAGDGLRLVFQPIVDLQSGRVAGYETLARFDGVAGVGPDTWFREARARGLEAALDAAVVTRALAWWRNLPRDCFLSVNVEPSSLPSPELADAFAGVDRLDGLVLEVTEHLPLDRDAVMLGALDRYRTRGAHVAVDDAGAGYAGLQAILALRPGFLKIDASIVSNVDVDEAKRALIRMLGALAGELDAWIIAEGVERPEELLALQALGVPLAQGYFLARPAPPWAALEHEAEGVLAAGLDRVVIGGLSSLVMTTPWMRTDELGTAGRMLASGEVEHLVLVDDHHRPVGIVDADSALAGTFAEAWHVNARTSVREVAGRLATSTDASLPPLVVCHDDTGAYVGTVSVRRLLAALAAG